MRRLFVIGLNHTTAPLAVREKLAFTVPQRDEALRAFHSRFDGCEAVLLSTCNRVEFYVARAAHESLAPSQVAHFLAEMRGVPASQFESHLYHRSERGVVEHLFDVACSLDSMVLGETQILGQVREAYDAASRAGTTGTLLNPLFQRAVAVAKQVMNDTSLAEGRVSVASVAVDHARRIFETFSDKTVLSIGAGKMAGIVLQHLGRLAPRELLVCNRDPAKARVLSERLAMPFCRPVPLEALDDHLVAADIVLCSTGATKAIITRARFERLLKLRRYRPIFLIDIAVPRDVEASVGEIENVYLYNLDDLQQVVQGTQSNRQGAVDAARGIVARQVEEFIAWHRQRELGPAIHELYRRYHEIAQQELAREVGKLPNITAAEKAHLEEFARRLVNKLLHGPVQVLHRVRDAHLPATQYLHTLEKLFQLDEDRPPHSNGASGEETQS